MPETTAEELLQQSPKNSKDRQPPTQLSSGRAKLSLSSRQPSEDSRQGKQSEPCIQLRGSSSSSTKQHNFSTTTGSGVSNDRKGYRKDRMLRRFQKNVQSFFSSIRKLVCLQMRNIKYSVIFDNFTRRSTIHGICHAALAPSSTWKKIWYAVFAVCFAILVIQVSTSSLNTTPIPKVWIWM
uniref:Uncharacterized protein n=1 Tax=Ditylenchus dipsaci TaxID=166011 RepID=A0A915CVG9_9BILA